VLCDAGRLVSLVDDGWRIVRVTRHDLWAPARVVDTVRHVLAMAR
jgi:YD repeat-containing protein